MKKTMAIVLSSAWRGFQPSLYDLEATALLTDTHPQLLLHYVELGLVEPVEMRDDHHFFTESDIAQIRRISRLRRDLGVNINGIGIILHLLDQIEELRLEIQWLRGNR